MSSAVAAAVFSPAQPMNVSVTVSRPLVLALPGPASDLLKDLNGFMAKSDGRDKFCALVQYVCMFIAAGQATPGNAKKVQMSVAAARKVFRVMKPLEVLVPLLTAKNMLAMGNGPLPIELLKKVRPVCNAVYFGADHVVWASQAGLLTDKSLADRSAKLSLWGWFYASLCTVIIEGYDTARALPAPKRREGESEGEYAARCGAAAKEFKSHGFVLTHALVQAGLAMGLLQLTSMKPKTTGTLGIIASLMNCWMLWPAAPAAPAVQAAPAGGKKTN